MAQKSVIGAMVMTPGLGPGGRGTVFSPGGRPASTLTVAPVTQAINPNPPPSAAPAATTLYSNAAYQPGYVQPTAPTINISPGASTDSSSPAPPPHEEEKFPIIPVVVGGLGVLALIGGIWYVSKK